MHRMYHVWIFSSREVRMIPLTRIEVVRIWVKSRLKKFTQVLGLFHTHLLTRISHLTFDTKMGSIAKITWRKRCLDHIWHNLGIF